MYRCGEFMARAYAMIVQKELHKYFYLLNAAERRRLADRCRTSSKHIQNIIYGAACSPGLAVEIDKASGGLVPFDRLCKNVDWNYVRKSTPCTKQRKTVDVEEPHCAGVTQ